MKPRNLAISIAISVVLVIVLTVGALLWFNLRRMLPQHDGIVYLQGLHDTVQIVRDDWGIPHIYASNVDDLFFAQGYVHAQDRWWQMEFERRTGLGEIEELTGYNTGVVGNDIFIRTVGWNRSVAADLEALSEETRAVLEAYTAGVNGYIAGRHGGSLALEYTLLGLTGAQIEVRPWSPMDTLAWAKVMAWGQSSNWDDEITRMELNDSIGPEMTDIYAPPYPFDQRPSILTAEDLPISTDSLTTASRSTRPEDRPVMALNAATDLAGGVAPGFAPITGHAGVGSNSWVISGSNTASGTPLLANDPHLGIQMPSIWYEVGLHCRPVSEECPYDVVGFSLTGTPTVLIGHNQRIAWGLTNSIGDVQDLYILHINPENPLQYEYNGGWRDMEVVTEVIHFATPYDETADDPDTPECEGISGLPINEDGDLEIQVRPTHFGPIITDNSINDDCEFVAQNNDENPMALRWSALEPGDLLRATIELNKASDWESFREALSYWHWPPINFVYADVDGNIGYQLPFNVPIRAAGHDGQVPMPGWTDEYEWQGYIPYDLLPRILNPERGWIVTANHGVVPSEYYDQLADELGEDASYLISVVYAYGYRGQRLVDLVSSNSSHTVETVAEIQGDNHNLHAEEILPYLFAIDFEDETLAQAADFLRDWDLQNHMDSPQAALFEAFWVALVDNLWNDQLGFQTSGGGHVAWGTRLLMDMPDHEWWDDVETAEVETRDDILTRSLQDALDYMTATWGDDWDAWRWGAMHTATFVSNPLGVSGIGFIENLVNAGPVPASGGWDTVNRTSYRTNRPYAVSGSITSMRMIVDLGDLDNSRSIHTTGQSGHPFSPHYADMVDLWRFIRYHPMRFSEDVVEDAAANRLELRPAPSVGVQNTEE